MNVYDLYYDPVYVLSIVVYVLSKLGTGISRMIDSPFNLLMYLSGFFWAYS